MMPLRKSARSHSRVFPSDKSNMIEDYNGDDETVLSEEEDASAMDVDKKGITAEEKGEEIFVLLVLKSGECGWRWIMPCVLFDVRRYIH